MALIFADDFQQLATTATMADPLYQGGYVGLAVGQQIVGTIEAYGFDRPQMQQYVTQYYPNVCYSNYLSALCLSSNTYPIVYPDGVTGLRRKLKYKGDTLYFSFLMTIQGSSYVGTGTFLTFGDGLYTLSVLPNGNYGFNDVDTNFQAIYPGLYPSTTKLYHEIIIGPDYIEFWVSNDLVLRQVRTPVPVDKYMLGFKAQTYWVIYLHSLIICDNSGTEFNSRIGRKGVKTYTPTAIVKVESANSFNDNRSPLVLLKPTAGGRWEEAGTGLGSLISPDGFVTNSFTTPIDKTPLAALVNMQMKRRLPSGDGMTAVPYIKIGTVTTEGVRTLPSSLWDVFPCAVPIAPGQQLTTVEFGYVHDYIDMHKVFIDSRAAIEVYGEALPQAMLGSGFLAKTKMYNTQSVNNTTINEYVVPFNNPKFARTEVANVAYSAYMIDYAKTSLKIVKQDVTNTTFNQDQ